MSPDNHIKKFVFWNGMEYVPDFETIAAFAQLRRDRLQAQALIDYEDAFVAEVEEYCDHHNFRLRTGR